MIHTQLYDFTYSYLYKYMVSSNYLMTVIICLHTVIWFQVFLSNPNNFQTYFIDGDLTDTTTLSQSRPGSNGNEFFTPQITRTGASPPDAI